MTTRAELVVEQWRHDRVALNPGASAAELNDLASLIQRDLPRELRDFYSLANGMPDLTYDAHQVSFWSIAKIRQQQGGVWGDSELGFADFLIDSWRFIFRTRKDDIIVVSENVRVGEPLEVHGNFSEFLQIYLSDAPRLRIS
jgi:hypothetical protein